MSSNNDPAAECDIGLINTLTLILKQFPNCINVTQFNIII